MKVVGDMRDMREKRKSNTENRKQLVKFSSNLIHLYEEINPLSFIYTLFLSIYSL